MRNMWTDILDRVYIHVFNQAFYKVKDTVSNELRDQCWAIRNDVWMDIEKCQESVRKKIKQHG